MTDGPGPHLRISADLHLEVDGRQVQITAAGDTVDIRTDDPLALLAAVRHVATPLGVQRASARTEVAGVSATLAGYGLRARVTTRHGVLAEFGAGIDSPAGRLLFGTPAARLGAARVVARSGGRAVPNRVGAAVGVLALVVLGTRVRRRLTRG